MTWFAILKRGNKEYQERYNEIINNNEAKDGLIRTIQGIIAGEHYKEIESVIDSAYNSKLSEPIMGKLMESLENKYKPLVDAGLISFRDDGAFTERFTSFKEINEYLDAIGIDTKDGLDSPYKEYVDELIDEIQKKAKMGADKLDLTRDTFLPMASFIDKVVKHSASLEGISDEEIKRRKEFERLVRNNPKASRPRTKGQGSRNKTERKKKTKAQRREGSNMTPAQIRARNKRKRF